MSAMFFPPGLRITNRLFLTAYATVGKCCGAALMPKHLKRGQIGFCFRQDQTWVAPDPATFDMQFHHRWKDDIAAEVDLVRNYVRENGACFFDDIVAGTGLDWRLVMRAIWRLVWTGEATNDSFESIRYANVASGLSACYDLGTHPGKKGVTQDFIVRHMESRKLDPRLGRWAPTERLVAPAESRDEEAITAAIGQSCCWNATGLSVGSR